MIVRLKFIKFHYLRIRNSVSPDVAFISGLLGVIMAAVFFWSLFFSKNPEYSERSVYASTLIDPETHYRRIRDLKKQESHLVGLSQPTTNQRNELSRVQSEIYRLNEFRVDVLDDQNRELIINAIDAVGIKYLAARLSLIEAQALEGTDSILALASYIEELALEVNDETVSSDLFLAAGILQASLGEYDKAFNLLEDAHNLDTDNSNYYWLIGEISYLADENEKGVKLGGVALEWLRENEGEQSDKYTDALNDLGLNLLESNDIYRASKIWSDFLQNDLGKFGPNSPQIATTYNNLSLMFGNAGTDDIAKTFGYNNRQEAALDYSEKAVAISKSRLKSPEFQSRTEVKKYAIRLINRIQAQTNMIGDRQSKSAQEIYRNAETEFNLAKPIFIALINGPPKELAKTSSVMGLLHSDMGFHQKAISSHQYCISILNYRGQQTSKQSATCQYNLASTYKYMGKYELSEEHYQKSRTIAVDLHGNNHDMVAKSLLGLARLYEKMNSSGLITEEKVRLAFQQVDDMCDRLPKDQPCRATILMLVNEYLGKTVRIDGD